MANIQHWLDQIRRAIYGREVRSSIADAIEAINKEQSNLDGVFEQLIINAGNSNAEVVAARVKADGTQFNTLGERLAKSDEQFVELNKEVIEARTDKNRVDHGRLKVRLDNIDEQLDTKAEESNLKTLEVRMDTFTKLAEGSTTGDAELIDGRVGANGVTYSNIGTAIRTQFNITDSNTNAEIYGGYAEIKLPYIEGGYIDNTGNVIAYNNWKYTDFIDISKIEEQSMFVSTSAPDSTLYNAFYNSDKVFIKQFSASAGEIKDVPISAKYVRMSCQSHYSQTLSLFKKGCNTKINILEEKINNLGEEEESEIISLNKDLEPFIVQASEGLGSKFADTTKPLVFTHFSDVHTRQELWDRIIEFNNYYSDYLNFSIHTGDYCGANQNNYINLYAGGKECDIPVFNCVGNHDTYIDNNGTIGTKEKTKQLIFPKTDGWNVTFMNIANSMTYYKDFPTQKIRFIVLDYYFDIDAQCTWLLERLNGATALGYHVVTCMHEMTNVITNKLNTTFQTIDNFEALGGNKYSVSKFDAVIGDWIKTGGIHVANFAGHEHSDFIGYTDNNVLNICVQAATDDTVWTDGKRVKGTRTWDCFNVVAVETSTGTLKLVRIGNNSDHYLREKRVLTYDYINKNIISD